MVVTGVVMVLTVVMVMAREDRHGNHDHHHEKQRQQHLFHGTDYSREPQAVSCVQGKKNHVWQQSVLMARLEHNHNSCIRVEHSFRSA
ncbi:MAG: hypothetical protein ABR902_12400 [Candidatus Korobacteraceae bacterium]|jgi:hypothetical protein